MHAYRNTLKIITLTRRYEKKNHNSVADSPVENSEIKKRQICRLEKKPKV